MRTRRRALRQLLVSDALRARMSDTSVVELDGVIAATVPYGVAARLEMQTTHVAGHYRLHAMLMSARVRD